MDDLRVEVVYKEHGHISNKNVSESVSFYPEIAWRDEENTKYHYKELMDTLKKSLRLFNNQKIYDYEVYLYRAWDKRVFLVRQTWQDKEAGIFELYDYTDSTNRTANIQKVSRDVVFKRIKSYIDGYLIDNNIL